MPANVQELRRRIKGTKNIRQITKAMEMIAASKMRRAQEAALMSRPYADLAWEMVRAITHSSVVDGVGEDAGTQEAPHPLLRKVENPQVVLSVLVAPNRGLCGSLPTQVIAKGLADIGTGQRYVTVGRKAERSVLRTGGTIVANFDGFEGQPGVKDTKAISDLVLEQFTSGEVDAVDLVYTDFESTLVYRPKRIRLLPIGERDVDLGTVHVHEKGGVETEIPEFLFEPSPEAVLNDLLPRLAELQVYQVIVEALASEHSSRMVTMQNASKAADDLIDDFTLTYNSARQAAITAEIAEITGGRLALSR